MAIGEPPSLTRLACRRQGIVHRNLRMENMLLDGQYHKPVLKISGFGYSKAPDLDSGESSC